MLKKHSVLLGIIIALLLLFIATIQYPGGSQYSSNSVGYDWQNNYISNLFSPKAVNGLSNMSRPWAICGMLFLCASFTLFFISFSKKIPSKLSANIIKYCGIGAMLFAFLAVTPYHDLGVTVASILIVISMFYIMVFVFTTKLLFLKVLCVVCLVVSYSCNYMYYSRFHIALLPIAQKIDLLIALIWVLCLQYFTTKDDFPKRKNKIAVQK